MPQRRRISLEKLNLTYSTPQLESPENSSPIVTRAVAASLQGRYSDPYNFSAWQRQALRILGSLPQAAARFVISRFETVTGLDPAILEDLTIERLAAERLRDYAAAAGPFPCITLGAALGGAAAHLALALDGPFLPQAFVTSIRGGAPDGSVQMYYQQSAGLAQRLAEKNPEMLTIQHYDPVHDEWMTRYVNHLRFKLLDLPPSYREFLLSRLEPGGAVVYLDSQAQWLRYRTGERSVFQVGGWGDISPEEFLEGSPRLQAFSERVGLVEQDWRLPGFPLEQGPESEWGCEPGLGEALEDFCRQHGFRFVRIAFSEPHDYSRLAFHAVEHLLAQDGREPAGSLVEMFTQYDASAVMKSGLLPLWLIFNTWDSLRFLQDMRPHLPEGKPVFFSPLSTFTLTPDLVPFEHWAQSMEGFDWVNIGARPSHYPADARALVDWVQPLRRWVEDNLNPIRSRLRAEELAVLAENLRGEPPAGAIQ
jgi:hypothetical protein